MAWRLAYSLDTLRNQVNAAYPNRSKASDGTIGDAAHAASASDHNPNSAGVVCALDLTHDPTNGFDAHALAEHLRTHRHPNLKYIISRARIAGAWSNWQWQSSSGHHQHIHISVGVGDDGQSRQPYDDTTKWDIIGGRSTIVLTDNDTLTFYRGILYRDASPQDQVAWRGQSPVKLASVLINSPERTEMLSSVKSFGNRQYAPDWAKNPTNITDAEAKLQQIRQIVA